MYFGEIFMRKKGMRSITKEMEEKKRGERRQWAGKEGKRKGGGVERREEERIFWNLISAIGGKTKPWQIP